MSESSDEARTRRLLDVGRALVSELDLDVVLDLVLDTARELTGAQYAALGIFNEARTELQQFLTSGVEEEVRTAIGDLPRGRGLLGVLIEEPRVLRLGNVDQHPSSYGFPAAHPVMRSFLGVPILIRGEAWGNLYLTEKEGDQFSRQDEEAVVILADWAAIAIGNARLYETSEHRRQELERTSRGLEATRDVTVAIGEEIALERVLELIAKRGRALVEARSLVIMLRDGDELVAQAGAGHVEKMRGARLPISGSTSGQVLEHRQPERIADVAARLRIAPSELGVADAQTALLVPMVYRGRAVGVLAAFDRGGGGTFSEDDEQILRTFAASAATAVALAQSVQADRLRSSLAAAEHERRRWARELHDETLQGLGGLRVLLSSAHRRKNLERAQDAMSEAVAHIDREIENLRSLITELRPAALDELGLVTAIESLLDRLRGRGALTVDGEVSLDAPGTPHGRLDGELETTIYRLVQEALTNVVKHADASNVRVTVRELDGELTVEVWDDGGGFAANAPTSGFGLAGMRERVILAGGTLTIDSEEGGTLVCARMPARRATRTSSAAPKPARRAPG